MPWAETAEPTDTEIWRADRSIDASFWITGSTNTLAPITTFWPDRSVLMAPVSGFVTGLPLRPVTMKASFGPGHLDPRHDDADDERGRGRRAGSDPMAMGPMAPFRCECERNRRASLAPRSDRRPRPRRASTTRRTMTTDSVPRGQVLGGGGAELDRLAAEVDEHLAGAAGAHRRHDPGLLADERGRGRGGVGRAVEQGLARAGT